MNPDAEGTRYPQRRFVVEAQHVAAFRAVVGGAEGIPPTFVTAAEFLTFPDVLGDPNLGLDFSRVVHKSEAYEFRRPLDVGESLTVDTSIASIRRKGANGFLTIVTELRDDDGETVATATSTLIERAEG
jgi:hypothetical protein